MKKLVRSNILSLKPYSSARSEYADTEGMLMLDANENPYNNPYNRYPDPLQHKLKEKIAELKGVAPHNIFLGNGSDEAIDLVYRIFCEPRQDNVVSISPTYGMYQVCADINAVEYRPVLLEEDFSLDADRLLAATDQNTKVIWLCSPNNPTGNNLNRAEIEKILALFPGIVVIDEAYSDFSRQQPFRTELHKYPNMIILNTMSKAWGCAALRLGMAYAQEEIIELFNRVKYPYNINLLTQEKVLERLQLPLDTHRWIKLTLQGRALLMNGVENLPYCIKVYPSDANFFLAKLHNAKEVYRYLIEKGIIVRDRSHIVLCEDCLRITVGTRQENQALLAALRQYKSDSESEFLKE